MNRKGNRSGVRILLGFSISLVFLAGVFWEPYRGPDAPRHALAFQTSTWVDLPAPSSDWPQMIQNPLVSGILSATGMDAEDRDELFRDGDVKAWVDRLAAKDGNIAFVPYLGRSNTPGIVFTTWVGGKSTWIVGYLKTIGLKDFTLLANYRGRACFRIGKAPANPQQPQLVATIAEGVLIGVFHPEPDAVFHVLDTFDGFHQNLLDDRSGRVEEIQTWAGDAPARGFTWIPGRVFPGPISWRLFGLSTPNLTADVRIPVPARDGLPSPEKITAFNARLFGTYPEAIVTLPAHIWKAVPECVPPGPIRQVLNTLVQFGDAPWITLALLNEEAGARVRGVRAPALVLVFHEMDDEATLHARELFLRVLNAGSEWGLEWQPQGESGFLALTGQERNKYTKNFSENERFTLSRLEGNTLFCSSLDVATGLHARVATPASEFEANRNAWRPAEEVPAMGYGYMALGRLARMFGDLASAYSLRLGLKGGADPAELAAYQKTSMICKGLQELGALRMTSHADATATLYQISPAP